MSVLQIFRTRLCWICVLLIVSLSACGTAAQESPEAAPLIPVLAISELVVGPNRIALGILQNGTPINQPELELGLRFFYLDGSDDSAVQGESKAIYRGEGLPFGLYVGYGDFAQPGGWSVEISIPSEGGEPQVTTMRLDVLADSAIPSVGDAALPTENLTVATQPDLAQLTSDANPDADLYQLTIADAIAAKQPFVVSFSTPGYCQTAVCAPNMLVLKQLKDQLKGQVNFIHVEVYPYPFGESFTAQKRVPAMAEWGMRTEPWTYLVDADGIIQARYEGGITFAEMQPALAQLAAGEPIAPLAGS